MDDPELLQFLDGETRAAQWRAWRETLEIRRNGLKRDLEASKGDPIAERKVVRALRELETALDAIRTEEAVAQFVEDSVQATLARPEPELGPSE
jgi:hypothetical protein